jgi:hypothetical protein
MRGLTSRRIIQLLMLITTPLWLGSVCHAGESAGFIPTTQGPQLLLYIAKPLGTRGAAKTYGLRIEQASALTPPTGAYQLSAVRRRELVDLRFGPRTRPTIEFGRRLTWDIGSQH